MIQVPHHGSYNNSDDELLNINNYKNNFYFTSAISTSKYHPSYFVVKEYIKNTQYFYLVDENDYSTVIYFADIGSCVWCVK